uniref:Uncharacterized protein n=1 Tax=Peronospora matthiolae TaxID=2874970 RepID=A0AAV1VC57_9STRA
MSKVVETGVQGFWTVSERAEDYMVDKKVL